MSMSSTHCEPEPEPDFSRMGLYASPVTEALTSFNYKEGTNFNFVKLVDILENLRGIRTYVHLNFIATDNGGASSDGDRFGVGIDGLPPRLFYAEIVCTAQVKRTKQVKHTRPFKISSLTHRVSNDDSSEDEIVYEVCGPDIVEVTGLALLLKVDTANPLGMRCSKCDYMSVVHPGPRSGYRVVAGDQFESAGFHEYNFLKVYEAEEFESPWGRSKVKHTMDRLPMFLSCARKALQHFNNSQRTSFSLVDVEIGFSVGLSSHLIVHLNFWAKWPEKYKEPLLFFSELLVPMLRSRSFPPDWDDSEEQSIEVEGCCIITKRESGPEYFGRVCEICVNGVIHSGFTHGYDILAGDLFEDAQFMEIGNGIF